MTGSGNTQEDDLMKKTGAKLTKNTGEIIFRKAQDIEPSLVPPALLEDLQSLIESARIRVAVGVNAEMMMLYWNIGTRIRADILGKERAAYGKMIVATVSQQLTHVYGAGFGQSNLFAMIRCAELYPDVRIVQTRSGKLSWSHFVELIKIDDPLQREFYTEMCRLAATTPIHCRTLDERRTGRTMRRRARWKRQRTIQNCFGLFPIRSFIGLGGEIKKQERHEDLSGCLLPVPAF